MQLCGSNCTKLIAGVTPSGRSSQSSASGASASPVYFPSPTAAAGSWLCTAPVWRHIPSQLLPLGQLPPSQQDSGSQPLPSHASPATRACSTSIAYRVSLHGSLQSCHPGQPVRKASGLAIFMLILCHISTHYCVGEASSEAEPASLQRASLSHISPCSKAVPPGTKPTH